MVSLVCQNVARKSMSNPYPNRDIEELYIEHSSVWDEVLSGDLCPESALDYMKIEPNTKEWYRVLDALKIYNPPL